MPKNYYLPYDDGGRAELLEHLAVRLRVHAATLGLTESDIQPAQGRCRGLPLHPDRPQCRTGHAGGGGLFPDLSGSAYRAEAAISNADGSTIPVVMIRDGRNSRMEFVTPEGASIVITNGETNESYMIATANVRQIAFRASELGNGMSNPLDNWQSEVAQTATRTGDCSVAGENGAEWTKTSPEDGTDSVCVTQDGIILRATDDGRVAWETTSVQRGAQSADLFTLPQGVQVMDLGNMGALANQAVEAAKQRGN